MNKRRVLVLSGLVQLLSFGGVITAETIAEGDRITAEYQKAFLAAKAEHLQDIVSLLDRKWKCTVHDSRNRRNILETGLPRERAEEFSLAKRELGFTPRVGWTLTAPPRLYKRFIDTVTWVFRLSSPDTMVYELVVTSHRDAYGEHSFNLQTATPSAAYPGKIAIGYAKCSLAPGASDFPTATTETPVLDMPRP
jgi:hypothetical protein